MKHPLRTLIVAIFLLIPILVGAQVHIVNPNTGEVVVLHSHGLHLVDINSGDLYVQHGSHYKNMTTGELFAVHGSHIVPVDSELDDNPSLSNEDEETTKTETYTVTEYSTKRILVEPGYWDTIMEEECEEEDVSTHDELMAYQKALVNLMMEMQLEKGSVLSPDEMDQAQEETKKKMNYPTYAEVCTDIEKKFWVKPVYEDVEVAEEVEKTREVTIPAAPEKTKTLQQKTPLTPVSEKKVKLVDDQNVVIEDDGDATTSTATATQTASTLQETSSDSSFLSIIAVQIKVVIDFFIWWK